MMPNFGLGTYTITGDKCIDIVSTALNFGYTMIDTAELYQNHKEISFAIKKSNLTRDDIWITSKIHNKDQRKLNIAEAIDKIYKDLETNYMDLILLHSAQKNYVDAYKELIRCQNHFNIRKIGVSNFRIHELEGIIYETNIKPYLNQIEIHPFNKRIELRKYMEINNIISQAYGSLTGIELLNDSYFTSDELLLGWSKYYNLRPIPTARNYSELVWNYQTLKTLNLNYDKIIKLDNITDTLIKYKQHADDYILPRFVKK